jgi:hypothetical protein
MFGRLTGPSVCLVPWDGSSESAHELLDLEADNKHMNDKGEYLADFDTNDDMLRVTRIRMRRDPGEDLSKEVTKWWGDDEEE